MPKNTNVLVAEGGMRGLGEIELISKYTKPNRAIITNVGTAHIGRLGSADNIAKAKCEIASFLKKDGVLIAPDNALIKKYNSFVGKNVYLNFDEIKILKADTTGTLFDFHNHNYFVPLEGEHNVQNACLVIETALSIGMTPQDIANGLKNFKPIDKRWEIQNLANFQIINDCYNANPDSVKAAVKTFLNIYSGKKVLILGDMGELGNDSIKYHVEIGEFLNNYDFDCLLTFGELSKNINPKKFNVVHFDDKKNIAKYLLDNFNENTNVLLKASRSMKFEEIIEEINSLCH